MPIMMTVQSKQQITVMRKFVKDAKRNMILMMKQRKVHGSVATTAGGGTIFLVHAYIVSTGISTAEEDYWNCPKCKY